MNTILKESDRPIFSVSDLTLRLQRLVEGSFTDIRVQGEISGLKRHTSGHQYFTLKDSEAVIDAVCWRGTKLAVSLEDGLEVIATGRLTIYGARSKYQMIVEHIEPTGQGALLKLLEERKARMLKEGIFASDRKKPLPPFPQIIGVVTSPTGAVLRDILHRITDRYPCHVLVWPTLVQGQGADQQIVKAIEGFNRIPHFNKLRPDVLIVARGGGSLEDLWTFNEEAVVYAVAHSEIPIISAVGHETDVTLIDFAADKRAPTPTAAAEIALPVIGDLWFTIQNQEQRAFQAISRRLDYTTLKVEKLAQSLPKPDRILIEKTQRVDDISQHLNFVLENYLHKRSYALLDVTQRLKTPMHSLILVTQRFTQLSNDFQRTSRRYFENIMRNIALLSERLEQVSYKRTLERGYAIATEADGTMIRFAKDFPKLDPAKICFSDGEVPVVRAVPVPKKRGGKGSSESKQGSLF